MLLVLWLVASAPQVLSRPEEVVTFVRLVLKDRFRLALVVAAQLVRLVATRGRLVVQSVYPAPLALISQERACLDVMHVRKACLQVGEAQPARQLLGNRHPLDRRKARQSHLAKHLRLKRNLHVPRGSHVRRQPKSVALHPRNLHVQRDK